MAATDILDTEGMFAATAGLPEQIEEAAEAAAGIDGLPAGGAVEQIVAMGMGGSGIAGNILLAAAGPLLPLPVVVTKSYECPAFVSETSLVFAISFSGNTEETLQAVSDAALQGAKVVVITSGGELATLARSWGVPLIPVPASLPQPRTGVGAMSIPPLVVLERMGLLPGARHWIAAAVEQLRSRRDQIMAAGPACEPAAIARQIGRTWPVVHGGGLIGATAAQRWKTQVNENAKSPAFWNAQPELCHNEVCGWGQSGDVTRQLLTLVYLRHDAEHPQVSRRFELVRQLVSEVVAHVIEVRAGGDGDLAQLFDLVLIGDFVSLWLATHEGIDPGPVPVLEELKAQLASP